MKRKIGVITTSRADYSIFVPLLEALENDPDFELTVLSIGMHQSHLYGNTVETIKKDGFQLVEAKDTLVFGDKPLGIVKSMGECTKEMGHLINSHPQDVFVCLGDRFEMFAAASAVIPFKVPLVHLHGGEITEGAIDEKFRHSITKLADIHFTSCEAYRNRVIQMGANPKKTFNFGALGVENIFSRPLLNKDEIKQKFRIDFTKETVLVTYQPVTTEYEKSEYFIDEFCSAVNEMDYQFVITLGNADTSGSLFIEKLSELGKDNPEKYKVFENLGLEGYHSVMNRCEFLLGNSSSGIIEAASLNKPVVNIGNRQKGREAGANVIHCAEDKNSILDASLKAKNLTGKKFENIYFQENTSEKILKTLKTISLETEYCFFNE